MSDDPRQGLVSASFMGIAQKCSGSVRLVNELRERNLLAERHTQYTQTGTKQHRAHITGDLDNLNPEEAAAVVEREDVVRRIADELFPNGWVEDSCERMPYLLGEKVLFTGEVDRLICNRVYTEAFIPDFKSIRWGEHPSTDENLQLRAYVVLVKHHAPCLGKIHTAIIQTGHKPKVVTYEGDDLTKAEFEIVRIAQATLWNSEKREAGAWCKHCPAKPFCPEARQYIEVIRTETLTLDLDALKGPRLGQILEKLDLYDDVRDAIREHAKALLKANPDPTTGWEVSNGSKVRKIKLPALACEHLMTAIGPEEALSTLSISVGKAERAYKKAKLEESFDEFMGDFIELDPKEGSLQKIKCSPLKKLNQ